MSPVLLTHDAHCPCSVCRDDRTSQLVNGDPSEYDQPIMATELTAPPDPTNGHPAATLRRWLSKAPGKVPGFNLQLEILSRLNPAARHPLILRDLASELGYPLLGPIHSAIRALIRDGWPVALIDWQAPHPRDNGKALTFQGNRQDYYRLERAVAHYSLLDHP